MGTVSIRMPDDEIEKLERLAEREGKSRSAFLRELAEEEIEKESDTYEALEEIFGILSDEEAEGIREAIRENRKKMNRDFKKRQEELFEE